MSTKTSIKRIALVAVSALGFGLLSVVPAKAAITAATPTFTSPSVTVATGVAAESTFTVVTTDDGSYADTTTVKYTLAVTSKPAGSTMTIGAPAGTSAASTTVAFKTGGETAQSGWALSNGAGGDANKRIDTCATGASCTALNGLVRGTVSLTASTAGTYVITLTADASAGTDGTATFTVVVNGQNAGRQAYISTATTVDVDAAGTAYSLYALSNTSANLAVNAPGAGKSINGAVSATAIASMTVPVDSYIVFRVTPGNGVAFSASSRARLTLAGVNVADVTLSSADPGVAQQITAPGTAGTYAATLTISGANGSFDPALTENISFTLVVGADTTALLDFGNAVDETASVNGSGDNTTGTIVPSVGVNIVETSGRVAQMVGFAPTFKIKRNAGATDGNDSASLATKAARLVYSVAGPTGAAVSVVDAKVSGVATTSQTVKGSGALKAGITSSSIAGTTVYFNPATAGTYTITVYHDQNRGATLSAGEAVGTATVVIAADALPSITFTKYGTSTTAEAATAAVDGQLVKVSLRNGTTPWTLAANETLVLTPADTSSKFFRSTSFAASQTGSWNEIAGGATLSLTAANFNGNGDAWFNIGNDDVAGGTFTINAAISGGTASGASGSFTITTIKTDSTASVTTDYVLTDAGTSANTLTNANYADGTFSSSGDVAVTTGDTAAVWYVKQGVATSVNAEISLAKDDNYKYFAGQVVDTLGLITGVAGATYVVISATATTGTLATDTESLSVTIPATTVSLATNTKVADLKVFKTSSRAFAADISIAIHTQTATPTSVLVDPANVTATTYAIRAAAASSNKFTATVVDQYGNAMAGQSVTAQVTAGRNVQLVATPLVTDANGQVSFTVADTYVGTLVNSDTLKFITTTGSKEGVVTINYAAYNPVSTVTITGGASADIAPAVTYSLISTGTSGASASAARVKMTATLKDANGATLPAGIPVKWAISGLTGTSAILVDATTGYDWSTSMTNSNGEAITYVYAWGTGTVSVTATAGAVTSATAGKINFANAAGDARVVSATVKNNIITAKVVDRYGNPVKGVSLTATRNSGVGYFSGSASSGATGETNALGTVDFVMTGGAANVTVATTTLNAGQTSSAAGYVGATAITATSIGASLSPAGVQSVTVDVTSDAPSNIAAQAAADAAADAAAEAIDAANAATDAANLAAEAADAATVAAEEARDAADAATAAVEELATQVATLMAALKAQITTLANTVAKIAKKVRA